MVRVVLLTIAAFLYFATMAMAQEKIMRLDGEVITVPPASLFESAESGCKRIADIDIATLCSRTVQVRRRRWNDFVRLHKAGKRADAQAVHYTLVRTKRDFVEAWPDIKIE